MYNSVVTIVESHFESGEIDFYIPMNLLYGCFDVLEDCLGQGRQQLPNF